MTGREIKLFAMDVDGTLTDGKIYMGSDGEAFKAFDIKDGMGIRLLAEGGVIPVIITGRKSKIVECRARELGITELYQGISDKAAVLQRALDAHGLCAGQSAYIGDDVNDLSVMELSGLSFAPADAVEEVKQYADVTLRANGGCGAVREAAEYILKKNNERKGT